ncbi:MAG: translocation/assembly module TamB domain-containing protein, partial [Synechococcus sp.]
LQARTDNLNLAGLRGQGQIDLQQVADLGDFVADVEWDGGGLNINNGLALDAIAVNGRIPVNSETFAIGPVALALVADNLQLETLPVLSSQPIGGIVSFQGTITGPLDNLRLAANATANSLAIAALAFEPLQGPVNWQANQGVSLDLVESGSADDTEPDRIFLTTGADFFPTKVNVRQGITTIDGARQNDLLNLQVVQVPLSLLNGILPGYFGGTLDSTLAVNLQDRSVMGDFVAEQPHWAGLKVSRLESGFSFSNNVVTLNNGQLALEGTVIEANGSVTLPSNTGSFMRGGRLVRNQPLPAQVDLFVSAENGKLEDVLAGLDWNEWSDIIQSFEIPELGTAEDLRTNPILSWQRSLYDQISAYAYIVDRLDSAVVSDPRIPNLANLKGDFQGDIRLVGLLNNPIAQVDFQGENWSLEEFLIEKLELNGLLKDLQLNITTFTAKTDNRFATARGTFGLDEIEGAIQVNEFPIELLQRFVPSSPSFSGDLSLTTDLAGSLSNPKVEGDMRLDQATFNEEPIYAVLGDYSYQNSILQLNGSMAINSADIDDPATLVGTIPYQFPLVTVPPKSDRFAVQIEARDSELIFVNLLTDAIALQSPKGELLVGFQGRFDGKTIHDLTLAGNLSLRDTTLDAIASPEPLTNLNTRVFFDFDRIHVESFSTDFVGGQITAAGFLPVSEPDKLDSDMSPLTIAIDPTQIELPDLYNGKVSGDIAIAGSLLAPKISGEVNVWEGFVDISPRNTQATVTASVGTYQPPSPSPIQPEFDGFKLVLGDRLNIGWEPIFRFTAKGDLSLYGPLDSPQGEGTISLTRGAITAGPAFLRLDRSWPNTAVFSRENGLDPDLNVRVFTRAEEIDRSTGGGDPKNEVVQFTGQNGQGSDFSARRTGSTRTIEIRATVQGKASKLAGGLDSSTLVFSSVPDRSQSEIRNLLAQSIVSDLVGTALESTVTSTLFGGENAIGDRLGLDEVSIGTFYGRKNETSLGLEVARDLGRNISISAEGSLTEQEEDPRLGLRYRVNNSWLLRGRSDFNRDTRGSIEFETRF